MLEGNNGGWRAALAILLVAGWLGPLGGSPAMAEDRLLQEVVEFTGTIVFLEHKVPGLVIGAVRNGERTVAGFGETSTGSGIAPDGKTTFRIGSVTKTMTGAVLAALAADGTVALTDPLEQHLGWSSVPARDGKTVRLVDLATHAGGFPREVPHEPGPPDNPFATLTRDAFIAALNNDALLFAPGTGAVYSNLGFDLLAAGLSGAAAKPYPDLLADRVTGPLGMTDTAFELDQDQKARLMQGHDFAGEPLPDVPSGPMTVGSGGLYSTVDDVLTWLEWQLDRFSANDAEMRHIGQAIWLQRDNLSPAFGLDESGRADALALAWIVMMPEGDRPLILQKAGGLQGVLCYAAFAPTRGIGAFIAINTFDFTAAKDMADAVNGMIAALAQR